MMDLIYSMYQGALFDSFEIIATLTKKPKILNLLKRFFEIWDWRLFQVTFDFQEHWYLKAVK